MDLFTDTDAHVAIHGCSSRRLLGVDYSTADLPKLSSGNCPVVALIQHGSGTWVRSQVGADGFYFFDDTFDDAGDNGVGANDQPATPVNHQAGKDLAFEWPCGT